MSLYLSLLCFHGRVVHRLDSHLVCFKLGSFIFQIVGQASCNSLRFIFIVLLRAVFVVIHELFAQDPFHIGCMKFGLLKLV